MSLSMSGRSSTPSIAMSEVSIPSKWTSEAGPESLFGGKDAPLFGRRQRRARGPRLPVIAVNGEGDIERMPEAKKQVALADRIVVTKSDIADAVTTGRLVEKLGSLNAAPVGFAVEGEIEPSFLLTEPFSPRHNFDLGGAEHSHGLCSFALIFEKPLSWAGFEQTMTVLTALRGPHLPRV